MLVSMNDLLKKLNLQKTSDYNRSPEDFQNYKQHIRYELFLSSQHYRKFLGIPVHRNYNLKSPYEEQLNLLSYHHRNNALLANTTLDNSNFVTNVYSGRYVGGGVTLEFD